MPRLTNFGLQCTKSMPLTHVVWCSFRLSAVLRWLLFVIYPGNSLLLNKTVLRGWSFDEWHLWSKAIGSAPQSCRSLTTSIIRPPVIKWMDIPNEQLLVDYKDIIEIAYNYHAIKLGSAAENLYLRLEFVRLDQKGEKSLKRPSGGPRPLPLFGLQGYRVSLVRPPHARA